MGQQLTEAPRDADERLVAATLEALEAAALVSDADGRIRYQSRGARLLLGGVEVRTTAELFEQLSPSLPAEQAEELRSWRRNPESDLLELSLPDGRVRLRALPLGPNLRLWIFLPGPSSSTRRELLRIEGHDLRSPLANIRSYAGMLLSGRGEPVSPRVRRAAEIIARNADRGLAVVEDWIDERMGQAGLLEVESERVSIGPPLRGAVEERREEARRQGIEIDAEIPDGLPALRGESQALQRIFGTLIDAALRRSASGQEITVRADSDDEQVWVRVSASGAIPSPAESSLAFDREHQTLQHRKMAIGSGLALAARLAKLQGGEVGLLPTRSGSVYYAVFPVA